MQNLASIFGEEWKPASLPISRLCLPSRRVNGSDCEDRTLLSYGFVRPDGSAAFAYWNAVPLLTQSYEGTISFFAGMPECEIRLINPADGSVYRIPEEMAEKKKGGVLLKNLPVTDVPLILTFGNFAEIQE